MFLHNAVVAVSYTFDVESGLCSLPDNSGCYKTNLNVECSYQLAMYELCEYRFASSRDGTLGCFTWFYYNMVPRLTYFGNKHDLNLQYLQTRCTKYIHKIQILTLFLQNMSRDSTFIPGKVNLFVMSLSLRS